MGHFFNGWEVETDKIDGVCISDTVDNLWGWNNHF